MTLHYTPDHEWLQSDTSPVGAGDIVTVGITHHAQDALGDVVFVDLPEVGKTLTAREVAGVVESVKAAADVVMPVSGEVTEVNEAPARRSVAGQFRPAGRWLVFQGAGQPARRVPGLDGRDRLRRLFGRSLNPKRRGGRHVDAIRQTAGRTRGQS